jgi:hypothetical protein
MWSMGEKSNFVSERAKNISKVADEVFNEHGDKTTYSQFKRKLNGDTIDAVEYNDVRKLWRGGDLSPDAVDSVL